LLVTESGPFQHAFVRRGALSPAVVSSTSRRFVDYAECGTGTRLCSSDGCKAPPSDRRDDDAAWPTRFRVRLPVQKSNGPFTAGHTHALRHRRTFRR
jgi:hypothetical protein